MLGCMCIAYLLTSAWESLAHWQILHASRRSRQAWRRLGGLGILFRRAYFYHNIIHHRRTYTRSFFQRFDSDTQKRNLDVKLKNDLQKRLLINRYGVTVSGFWEICTFITSTVW